LSECEKRGLAETQEFFKPIKRDGKRLSGNLKFKQLMMARATEKGVEYVKTFNELMNLWDRVKKSRCVS